MTAGLWLYTDADGDDIVVIKNPEGSVTIGTDEIACLPPEKVQELIKFLNED